MVELASFLEKRSGETCEESENIGYMTLPSVKQRRHIFSKSNQPLELTLSGKRTSGMSAVVPGPIAEPALKFISSLDTLSQPWSICLSMAASVRYSFHCCGQRNRIFRITCAVSLQENQRQGLVLLIWVKQGRNGSALQPVHHVTEETSSLKMLLTNFVVALDSIKQQPAQDGALEEARAVIGSYQETYELYSEIVRMVHACLQSPQYPLTMDTLKTQVKDSKLPEVTWKDLITLVNGEQRYCANTFHLKLEKLRWRIDVTISSRYDIYGMDQRSSSSRLVSVLSRVLEPCLLLEMTLSNGRKEVFEVSLAKFHQVRYHVTSLLNEMENIEKRKLFKSAT
uniref:COMM domain-containing protein 5 n=1 Tax=Timema poppense TaxID=170557 RepID=A0A7R9D5F3_TIMPO|nr:unnamed protein product [Timema poppensis]